MEPETASREPGWAWLLVGLTAALARGEAARRPDAAVPREALERWAPRDDPERMAARDLRRLPGVGDARAAAAIEARWRAREPGAPPFAWVDVPGIGAATARKVEAWLAARSAPDEPP